MVLLELRPSQVRTNQHITLWGPGLCPSKYQKKNACHMHSSTQLFPHLEGQVRLLVLQNLEPQSKLVNRQHLVARLTWSG